MATMTLSEATATVAKHRPAEEERLIVTVTPTDIRDGVRNHQQKCPVALALARAWAAMDKPARTFAVGRDGYVSATADSETEDPTWTTLTLLPETAQAWIAGFDAGKTMHPLSFSTGLVPF